MPPSERTTWSALDVELVIFVACAIVIAVGVANHHFGGPESLAMLGVIGVLRVVLGRVFMTREKTQREILAKVHVDTAFEALERGDVALAIEHCRLALRGSDEATTRRDATRLLAYAYASTNAWPPLLSLLESDDGAAIDREDLVKYERAARELGRIDEASRIAARRMLVGGLVSKRA